MVSRLVVLSGPIASGKTTLSNLLEQHYGLRRFKTRQLIQTLKPDVPTERVPLQDAGDTLDRSTKGKWVAMALARMVQELPEDAIVLVDSVRREEQIDGIRHAFRAHVVHVHLTAQQDELAERYAARQGDVSEVASYAEAQANPTESAIENLAKVADVCIDTHRTDPDDVMVRVAAHLGLYGKHVERLVDVLVGGQYGSEGKGHIASYLAREYDVLVRVGGPNAGHTVCWDPEPYTFHQLPSGTRHSEAKIVLGPGTLLWPPRVLQEIADCGLDTDRLTIDPNAMVIAESDRKKEAKLKQKIGSTAQGVGYGTVRKILRTSASPKVKLARDVRDLKPYIGEARRVFERAFHAGKRVLLEGTQGTGLSLHHGTYPYVTSRDTSVGGCVAEAGIAPSRVRKTIMACRTYPIRVQNPDGSTSGPMKGEIDWKEVSRRSQVPLPELESTEKTSTTNRRRRVGEFDWALLRKAASLNGPTDVALTFVDYLALSNRDARRFEQLTPDTIRFIEEIERVACAPVSLITTRFHARSIIDRRAW